MSSAPCGLDVREYVYGCFSALIPDDQTYQIDARKAWFVTRVQFFAAAAGGSIGLVQFPGIPQSDVVVVANGCANFEPNGAHRASIVCSGNGSLVIVEYWFQAVQTIGSGVQQIPIRF